MQSLIDKMSETDRKEFDIEFKKWARVVVNLCDKKTPTEAICLLRKIKPVFRDTVDIFSVMKSYYCIEMENEILKTLAKSEQKKVLNAVNGDTNDVKKS